MSYTQQPLRYLFGVPIRDKSYMLGDNKSVDDNSMQVNGYHAPQIQSSGYPQQALWLFSDMDTSQSIALLDGRDTSDIED